MAPAQTGEGAGEGMREAEESQELLAKKRRKNSTLPSGASGRRRLG